MSLSGGGSPELPLSARLMADEVRRALADPARSESCWFDCEGRSSGWMWNPEVETLTRERMEALR